MTPEHSLRAKRVAHQVKQAVTECLARDSSDPNLSSVVVSDVALTADLGIATVKVRLLVGGEDAERRRAVMKSLARAGGRLRRTVGSALRLKRVPELRFHYDEGADAAERVEAILSEIARESAKR